MDVGNDDERREILVAGDVAAKVIAAIPQKTGSQKTSLMP